MKDTPPAETNLESLKQMIGAPDIAQPLLKDDAFPGEDVHSDRPAWKLPIPKLMLIGGALLPVFAFAGYFMMSSQNLRHTEAATNSSHAGAGGSQPEQATEELRQAREEIAALKSRMALNDQAYIQTQRSAQSQRERPPATVPRQTPQTRTPVISAPPATVRSVPSSPVISYRPPAPQIQMAPVRSVNSPRNQAPQTDPVEEWQRLAQLGSYGAIAPPETLPTTRTSRPQPNVESQRNSLIASAATIPTAQIAPTSADQAVAPGPTRSIEEFDWTVPQNSSPPAARTISVAQAGNLEQGTVDGGDGSRAIAHQETDESVNPGAIAETVTSDVAGGVNPSTIAPDVSGTPSEPSEIQRREIPSVSYPPVLTEAETAILQEQSRMQSLIAGANAPGRLETPVILENPDDQGRYLVVLAEPLKDNRGRVVIPADGKLLVRVDGVSGNGSVKLSATQAVWQTEVGQREVVLPEQVILIRGEDGNPLVAEIHHDREAAITARDVGQFALGAIRGAASTYTRANTRVQTGNGATIITENNPAPNILAGALEGGTDAILDTITERNQRAAEALEQRPNIPYIQSGTPVQVFVNQSMQMPM